MTETPKKYAGRIAHLTASLDEEELKDRFASVEFDGETYYIDEPSLDDFIKIKSLMDQMETAELDEDQAIEGIGELQDMLDGIAPSLKGVRVNFRRLNKIIAIFSDLVQMPEDSVLAEMGIKATSTVGGEKKDDSLS